MLSLPSASIPCLEAAKPSALPLFTTTWTGAIFVSHARKIYIVSVFFICRGFLSTHQCQEVRAQISFGETRSHREKEDWQEANQGVEEQASQFTRAQSMLDAESRKHECTISITQLYTHPHSFSEDTQILTHMHAHVRSHMNTRMNTHRHRN